ncbi:hypothetical protein BP422_15720 [Brevibacillus formosus]|uniref:Uncharacterized protein n=1 Tax=Brevibacillus formosus TaxID=54913 RepID=A0A220MIM5_9BACL|nr:hypothetical protein [Brevibacillus formosus]ASJ54887.1 hypothetical protein BP422_15720 [Brevibacillus formosus]
MLKDIAKVEGVASAKGGMFGEGVQEYRVTDSENRSIHLYVPVNFLKEKGLTKRYDFMKKAEEWLNTEEGKQYLYQTHESKFEVKK